MGLPKGQNKQLTPKQQIFCLEYLKDFNATRAAKAAGYSAKTANRMGAENLSKPVIRTFIEKAKAERIERVKYDADDLLRDLLALQKVSLADFIIIDQFTGLPKYNLSNTTRDQLRALESLQISESSNGLVKITRIKLSLFNRLKVLEVIGKHVKVNAFKEGRTQSGEIKIYIDEEDKLL